MIKKLLFLLIVISSIYLINNENRKIKKEAEKKFSIENINESKYLVKGTYELLDDHNIKITELPIGTWTDDYKQFLEGLLEPGDKGKKTSPIIKDYRDMSKTTNVDITVQFADSSKLYKLMSTYGENGVNGLEKLLRLSTTISTTNMHLFDSNEKLKKYSNVKEIIDDYYKVRLTGYVTRKAHIIKVMENELVLLSNKVRYIKENLDDTIDIRRKKKNVIIKTKKNYGFLFNQKIKRMNYSMGLFVYYFGSKKQYREVAHHTICFGNSYEKHLSKIFDQKILSNDISYYLHRPSATDPEMAPDGQDAFYVLVPVPNNLSGINWSKEGEKFKELVLDKMDKTVLPGIKENVVSDFYLTPDYFANELSTLHGSGFSIQPKFTQSAYFRFHNKSEIFENLYFVGAGTHPGAGMPGVLSSAKVLDELLG